MTPITMPPNGAHAENGHVSFGHNGAGQAYQQGDDQAGCPSWQCKINYTDQEPDGESVKECARNRGAFVREGHRQH